MTDVAAHREMQHLTLVEVFPAHEARETDPHYHVFNEVRARLKHLGKLVCWIDNEECDRAHPIELHHSTVEFALANIVDTAHFMRLYPEFHLTNDEDFLAWVEGEGNLLPLCVMHHRGVLGIHSVPYPMWQVQRYLKAGVSAPCRVAPQGGGAADGTAK